MLNSSDILRGYTDTIILAQLDQGDNYGYVISKNAGDHPRGIAVERGDPWIRRSGGSRRPG